MYALPIPTLNSGITLRFAQIFMAISIRAVLGEFPLDHSMHGFWLTFAISTISRVFIMIFVDSCIFMIFDHKMAKGPWSKKDIAPFRAGHAGPELKGQFSTCPNPMRGKQCTNTGRMAPSAN